MTYKDMNEYIIEKLKDPEEAEAYLNAALEDYSEHNDKEALSICLRNLVKARCSVSKFSEECNINRTHLYDIFNNQVNPQLDTLKEILNILGFTLQAKKKLAS